jgi:hypothetical protein
MTGWFAAASRPQQKHLVPTTLHRAADQIAGKLKEPADHICRLDYAGTAPIKVLARSYAARMSLQFFAGGASFSNLRKPFILNIRPSVRMTLLVSRTDRQAWCPWNVSGAERGFLIKWRPRSNGWLTLQSLRWLRSSGPRRILVAFPDYEEWA